MLVIGDEILKGQTQDRNLHFLGKFLKDHAIELDIALIIRDETQEIADKFSQTLDQYDLVICSGGLGPTRDDRTKLALSKVTETTFVASDEAAEIVKHQYERRQKNGILS